MRLVLSRAPLALRVLSQRGSGYSVQHVRNASYETSVNPQPPLSKSFESEGGKFDPEAGPPGPVHPKVKQLQKFYQTPNGRPLWRKTPFADFLYRVTVAGTIIGFIWTMYYIWLTINPKKKK